jgi:hypothetical protein
MKIVGAFLVLFGLSLLVSGVYLAYGLTIFWYALGIIVVLILLIAGGMMLTYD